MPKVQIWSGEDILETLVIGVDLATFTKKVMSPGLECVDYGCKFEVVNWVVLFVRAQLPRGISNHFASCIRTQPNP